MKKVVKLISILFLSFLIVGCGEKEEKAIVFEDYLYNQVMDVDNNIKFDLSQNGSIQMYKVKATFLGLDGTASFERSISPKKFVKNAFIVELKDATTTDDIEKKSEEVMSKVKNYTKIEDIRVSIQPIGDSKINNDDGILQNLIDNTGIICFDFEDKNYSYQVLIYNENDKYYMSIAYVGAPTFNLENNE